jgi:asparagine synthase (glutamine-hydrolysing)
MGPALRHRGPDGSGLLERPHALLGCERLRVVDLDPRGDQPFQDPSGRVWLVANGEIYNAAELRRLFADYPFRSRSDVEVIVPLYLACGLEGLARLRGMFAWALWDEEAQRLILARDRAGEKPLFYRQVAGAVGFASEIHPLLELWPVRPGLDRYALAAFVRLGYVPQPRTPFEGIAAVPSGTALVFEPGGCRPVRYWDPGQWAPVERPPDAAAQLEARLQAAVELQLTADVPLGVFTSGGVDSSLVAAMAARALGPGRLVLFNARLLAPTYDESPYARKLAAHVGAECVMVPVDQPALERAFDEFTERTADLLADPAVLPTFLLARTAREQVTVVLGGEGADELLGGYPTYLGHALAPAFGRLPPAVRRALASAAERLEPSEAKVPVRFLLRRFVEAAALPWLERHLAWVGTGLDPEAFALPRLGLPELLPEPGPYGALAEAMRLDYASSLRDQLLVKLDRAAMRWALEARSPYLDPEVTAFALRLDPALKVRGLRTKCLLKEVAHRWLPRGIVERRKRGLSVPLAAWLRGGLKRYVERLLAPERLRRQGVVSEVYVQRLVAEHAGGRTDRARALWTLIVLQRWLERWAPEVGG